MRKRRSKAWEEKVRKAREADIYDVVARRFAMPPRRARRYIRCITHDSLVIDQRKNIYHHNSTGKHGDPIDFLMEYYGLTFVQAVAHLSMDIVPRTIIRAEPVKQYKRPSPQRQEELERNLAGRPQAIRWWWDRGIDREMQRQHRLGCTERSGTIPIFDPLNEWVLAQIKHRAFPPKGIDLYRNGELVRYWADQADCAWPLYVPKRAALSEPVIYLVSGEIKAMVAAHNGLPSVSSSNGVSVWEDDWGVLFGDSLVVVVVDPGEEKAQEDVVEKALASGVNAIPAGRLDEDLDELFLHGASLDDVLAQIHA